MTARLDPDALEAAAEATEFTCGGRSIADSAYWNVLTFTAITAYLAAIEPRLRERVAALSIAAMDNGIVLQDLLHQTPEDQKEHVVVTPELAAAIDAKYAAHEAILALFGLEPNE